MNNKVTVLSILIIAIILFIGVFCGCKKPNNSAAAGVMDKKEKILPPSRVGTQGLAHARVELFSITDAFDEAEAVCLIRIGNWLGDNGTGTYFEGEVEKTYKGSLERRITIYQIGDISVTMEGFPLFTYGDRLLLFLKAYKADDGKDIKNSYELLGLDSAFFYAASLDDETYLIDTMGLFSHETMKRFPGLMPLNHSNEYDLVDRLVSEIKTYDPLIADIIRNYDKDNNASAEINYIPEYLRLHIYRLDDIESILVDSN